VLFRKSQANAVIKSGHSLRRHWSCSSWRRAEAALPLSAEDPFYSCSIAAWSFAFEEAVHTRSYIDYRQADYRASSSITPDMMVGRRP